MAIKWCLQDESTPESDAILMRLQSDHAFAPAIWPLEMVNVLLISERRDRLSEDEYGRATQFLSSLDIIVDTDGIGRSFDDVARLSRAHGLTSYDASYLELALRLSLPLASADRRLIRAANSAGVALVA